MARSLLRIILRILGGFMIYMMVIRIIRRFFPFPVPAFVGRYLDSDLRRAMQPPEPIIERSGIKPGMKVLEIGCGSGAYIIHVARAVGETGEVSALDIQPAMLQQLARKLAQPENQDVQNIKLFENSAYALPFEKGTFDVIYMITCLQEIPEPQRALIEAKRVLKPDGKLAITEFLPDPDYALMSTTVTMGQEVGFEVDALLGNLWTYTARFRKKHE